MIKKITVNIEGEEFDIVNKDQTLYKRRPLTEKTISKREEFLNKKLIHAIVIEEQEEERLPDWILNSLKNGRT